MISISVINESTVTTDAAIQAMLPAFTQQLNNDLAPVWRTDTAGMTWTAKGVTPPAQNWWLVFLDNSDQAGALAYHDLTNAGLPISKIFCETLIKDKASISVGATHELCEMMVDPDLNASFESASGLFWAGEVCDPVEDDKYGYLIGGTLVTNFVTRSWFGHEFSKAPYDFRSQATKQFQVLPGGYAQKNKGTGWHQITGADAEKKEHSRVAAPGSRRERRARGWQNWNASSVDFARA